MKREEAINTLRKFPIGLMDLGSKEKQDITEAIDMALAALRGPTREQVKNVWHGYRTSGCDVCLGSRSVGYVITKKYGSCDLDLVGDHLRIMGNRIRINFCPKCGRTLTDEAVDIIMQRLEALKGNG